MMFPEVAKNLPSNAQKSLLSTSNVEAEIPAWVMENFRQWKSRNNRVYDSVEVELYRMAIYYSNFIYIQMENSRQSEYVLGENQFMDLAQDEWAAQYLSQFPVDNEVALSEDYEEYQVPNAAKNWITEGKVGPILNQGSCGSCWAFSATETVQSYYAINKGELPSLSEQQLVDCSGSYGNEGCNGGWPHWALAYVKQYGITTSAAYPYTGRDGTCKVQGGAYKIADYTQTAGCSTLTANINTQPTSVCVDASNWSFYKSGTFSNCAKNINHAVLAVGYDANGNWIIQNSWGNTWGTNGLITLKAGDTCAVCQVLANAY
jgi:C1A family cysteine protease